MLYYPHLLASFLFFPLQLSHHCVFDLFLVFIHVTTQALQLFFLLLLNLVFTEMPTDMCIWQCGPNRYGPNNKLTKLHVNFKQGDTQTHDQSFERADDETILSAPMENYVKYEQEATNNIQVERCTLNYAKRTIFFLLLLHSFSFVPLVLFCV